MRARITWRVRRWSEATWVPPLDLIRKWYGDDIGEAVEMVSHTIRDRRDRPRQQDIKATLKRIEERPQEADLRHLDGYTEAELVTVAWREYRTTDLRALARDDLAACARLSLMQERRESGPSKTDDVALMLVRKLLRLIPADFTPAQRDELLRVGAIACGLRFTQKNIERLRTKAGRIDRPGSLFSRTRGAKPQPARRGRLIRLCPK